MMAGEGIGLPFAGLAIPSEHPRADNLLATPLIFEQARRRQGSTS
jgi:hypothetical protein